MDIIADKNYVLAHLKLYETQANKKWGQNFLIDNQLAHKIVEALEVAPDDLIIEIGPGLGALTYHLVQKDNRLLAAEIDPLMIEHLKKAFFGTSLELYAGDFLKLNLEQFNAPLRIVGNLPYYITSDLIEKLLLHYRHITKMVLMVQKEAYTRLTSSLGTKDYGPLPLLLQLVGKTMVISSVSRHSYFPEPHVDSLVFSLDIIQPATDIDVKSFYRVVKTMFAMRRKTMLNNLLRMVNDKEQAMAILDELGMAHNARPENGDLNFYIRLTRRIRN